MPLAAPKYRGSTSDHGKVARVEIVTTFLETLEAFGFVGDVMTIYWRNGFWRTSALGNEHWVEGHWVGRDNWDRADGGNDGSGCTTPSGFVHDEEREAKTYLTTCRWCGETVFYHTNGNGDSVLFDPPLGWPWEVHPCWTDYSTGKKTKLDISYTSEVNQYPLKPSLYFNQIINSYVDNFSSEIPKDNHALLLGLARLMDTARVGNYSIFGFSEIELSELTNLSIANLRQIHGRFYTLYQDGEVSMQTEEFAKIYHEIETKKVNEKYQHVISAIETIKEIKRGGFGFYGLTEDLLAKSMGLSIQALRIHFGQVYTVYASGNIHLSAKLLKQIQKPLYVPKKTPNQNISHSGKVSKDKDKILEVRRNNPTMETSSSSVGLIACPYCEGYVSNSKDKVNQHVKKKHPGKQLV